MSKTLKFKKPYVVNLDCYPTWQEGKLVFKPYLNYSTIYAIPDSKKVTRLKVHVPVDYLLSKKRANTLSYVVERLDHLNRTAQAKLEGLFTTNFYKVGYKVGKHQEIVIRKYGLELNYVYNFSNRVARSTKKRLRATAVQHCENQLSADQNKRLLSLIDGSFIPSLERKIQQKLPEVGVEGYVLISNSS